MASEVAISRPLQRPLSFCRKLHYLLPQLVQGSACLVARENVDSSSFENWTRLLQQVCYARRNAYKILQRSSPAEAPQAATSSKGHMNPNGPVLDGSWDMTLERS